VQDDHNSVVLVEGVEELLKVKAVEGGVEDEVRVRGIVVLVEEEEFFEVFVGVFSIGEEPFVEVGLGGDEEGDEEGVEESGGFFF